MSFRAGLSGYIQKLKKQRAIDAEHRKKIEAEELKKAALIEKEGKEKAIREKARIKAQFTVRGGYGGAISRMISGQMAAKPKKKARVTKHRMVAAKPKKKARVTKHRMVAAKPKKKARVTKRRMVAAKPKKKARVTKRRMVVAKPKKSIMDRVEVDFDL